MYNKIKEKLTQVDTKGREIINFAVLFSLITVLVIAFFDITNKTENYLLLFLVYLLIGVSKPVILKYPYLAWMSLSFILGEVVFKLLFTIFYYILILPIGLLMRLFKGDFLKKAYDSKLKSYWKDYDASRLKKENLENLY